jgi:ribose transport system substrate-binding protein
MSFERNWGEMSRSGSLIARVMGRRAQMGCLLALALVLSGCKNENDSTSASPEPASAKKTRIAVIPKGASAEFWKSIHAGAAKASEELGVDVIWKGPLKDDDLKAQIEVVQSFVAQGIDGIVVAPLSEKGLVSPVRQAKQSNIPVIVVDSGLAGEDHLSFVATDNYAGGKMGGEELARLLNNKGKVIMMRYVEGSASTAQREQGFLDSMKQHPEIEVVSSNQHGGATTESAFQSAENLLAATKAAEGGVDGVFCVAEATTLGMLLALRKVNMAGKIKFVGFDVSSKLLEGMRKSELDALVVQDPFKMGYLSVKMMAQHIQGEKIEKFVDTGVHLVTKANMDEPKNKELTEPDLKKWLKE